MDFWQFSIHDIWQPSSNTAFHILYGICFKIFPLTEIQYSWYLKVIFIHEHLHHLNTSLFQSMPHFPHSGHVFHYHCLLALRQNLRKDNPRLSLRLSSSCFSIPNAGFIGLGHHTQLLCSVLFLKHYKVSMLKGTGGEWETTDTSSPQYWPCLADCNSLASALFFFCCVHPRELYLTDLLSCHLNTSLLSLACGSIPVMFKPSFMPTGFLSHHFMSHDIA